jgi:hypothetical protein
MVHVGGQLGATDLQSSASVRQLGAIFGLMHRGKYHILLQWLLDHLFRAGGQLFCRCLRRGDSPQLIVQ